MLSNSWVDNSYITYKIGLKTRKSANLVNSINSDQVYEFNKSYNLQNLLTTWLELSIYNQLKYFTYNFTILWFEFTTRVYIIYSVSCQKNIFDNLAEGYSLIGQTLDLLLKDHQFEYHKSQNYWKLTWSLTSESQEISWNTHKLIKISIIN